MIEYTKEELVRFSLHFKASSSVRGHVLNRILNQDARGVSRNFQASDFFKYFYIENESIKNAKTSLLNNLVKNQPYHILHSYGKNGKSSFVNYLLHENEKDPQDNLIPIFFDLSQSSTDSIAPKDTFMNKCHNIFINRIFYTTRDLDESIKSLSKFIDFVFESHDYVKADPHINLQQKNIYLKYFEDFIYNFKILCDDYLLKYRNNGMSEADLIYSFKTRLNDTLNNIPQSKSTIVFCFILFWITFENTKSLNKNLESKKRSKLFFILDNIDDILSDLAEDVANNHVFFICEFVENANIVLNSFLNDKIPGLHLESDLAFLFVYRTANYLNVLNSDTLLNASKKGRFPDYFINAPKYKISTVKTSKQIFRARLHLYFKLCEFNKRKPEKKSLLIKQLIESIKTAELEDFKDYEFEDEINPYFSNSEIKDINNIFRLWNGNRICINDLHLYPNIDEVYDNLSMIKSNAENSYFRKGVFIYLFLNILMTRNKDNELGKFLDYLFNSYEDDTEKGNQNFKRLLLNVIINKCNDSENRKISNNKELREKGVSLFYLLEKFDKIESDGEKPYSIEDFEEFLHCMFYSEIDNWGHLLTCFKSTSYIDHNYDKKQGKKLNFKDELEQYKTITDYNSGVLTEVAKKSHGSKVKQIDKVRFYYNDNAYYLSNHVLRHFEYYSLFLDQKKPILLQLNHNLSNGENMFEFENTINIVFERVKNCLSNVICFYNKYFSDKYDLETFVCDSEFCLNDRLFFSDLISKHITYLNQFRMSVFDSDIIVNQNKNNSYNKKQLTILFNEATTLAIKNYLILFFNLRKELVIKHSNIPNQTLESTRKSFQKLLGIIRKIEKRGYDHYVSISTD